MAVTLDCESESPSELVNRQLLVPSPRDSDSASLEQAENLHFDKFPGDFPVTLALLAQGTLFENSGALGGRHSLPPFR